MSDIVDKCYNCARHHDLEDGTMICDVGNKNKILYDGLQHTEEYYWCNGKYQQQLGKEGRSLFDDFKSGKIFQNEKEFKKFKNDMEERIVYCYKLKKIMT